MDVGNVQQRMERVDPNPRSRLFPGFPHRGFEGAFVTLHESGRKRPIADSWGDRAATEQDLVVP